MERNSELELREITQLKRIIDQQKELEDQKKIEGILRYEIIGLERKLQEQKEVVATLRCRLLEQEARELHREFELRFSLTKVQFEMEIDNSRIADVYLRHLFLTTHTNPSTKNSITKFKTSLQNL
jgi:hypothetical protein